MLVNNLKNFAWIKPNYHSFVENVHCTLQIIHPSASRLVNNLYTLLLSTILTVLER